MVLSTNFYKVAKNALTRKRRPLTEDEKIGLQDRIVARNLLLNLAITILIGLIVAIGFAYIAAGFASHY